MSIRKREGRGTASRALIWATVGVLVAGVSAACTGQDRHTDSVAILVVDDFDPIKNGEKRPTRYGKNQDATKNCTFRSQEVGGKGAGDGVPPGVSHGALVFDQIAGLLDHRAKDFGISDPVGKGAYGLGFEYVPQVRRWTYKTASPGRDRPELLVVAVDTNEYETDDVKAHISEVINVLRPGGKLGRFDRFVVNMSFQIAPCDPKKWLEQAHAFEADMKGQLLLALYSEIIDRDQAYSGLRERLDRVAAQRPDDVTLRSAILNSQDLAPVRRLITSQEPAKLIPSDLWVHQFHGILAGQPLPVLVSQPADPSPSYRAYAQLVGDPLNIYFRDEIPERIKVVPVGAAGNGIRYDPPGPEKSQVFRFDFPFAPALWDSVVSVSASGGAEPKARASYSNSGEVLLHGAFQLNEQANTAGEKQLMTPYSVREDLRSEPPQGTSFAAPRLSYLEAIYLLKGGPDNCQSNTPTLGYTALGQSGGGKAWGNLMLLEAGSQYCPDFVKTTASITLTP